MVDFHKALHVHVLEIPGVGSFVTTTSDGDPHDHLITASDVGRMREQAEVAGVTDIAEALAGVDNPLVLTESNGSTPDHAHRARIGGRDFTTGGPETVTPTLETRSFPDVLTVDAVRTGRMPPAGESGLPPGLEQDVHGRFRFWLVADQEAAKRVRRVLVESGEFTDDTVRTVGGETRLVKTQDDGGLYIPSTDLGDPADPGVISSLDSAVVVTSMPPESAMMSARATNLADAEILLDRVLRYDSDALIEFVRGGEMEGVVTRAGLLPCCFETRSFGGVAFFSTRLPGGDQVEFLGKLPDEILAIYLRQRSFENMPHLDVSVPIAALSEQLAGEPTARDAYLARFLIDRELTGKGNARVHVLRALGYDLERVTKRAFTPISKRDEDEKRLVTGIVLAPNTADLGGDLIGAATHTESAADIRRLAHDYMEFAQTTGLQHQIAIDGRAVIVESYVLMADTLIGDQVVVEGTWIVTMRIRDDRLWELIQSGELTGFSIGGYGKREPLP